MDNYNADATCPLCDLPTDGNLCRACVNEVRTNGE